MIFRTYQTAGEFLLQTRAALEKNEAANNLMLGICNRLANAPDQITAQPYLAAVTDGNTIAAAAVMTPPYRLVVFSEAQDSQAGLALIAHDLHETGWPVPGVVGPSPQARAFAAGWTALTGAPHRPGIRMRVHELRAVTWPDYAEAVRGEMRQAAEAALPIVAQWIRAFHDEAVPDDPPPDYPDFARRKIQAGEIYLWHAAGSDQPVSMAAKARPTTHGIVVNMVYTPPELRGKGYATACVASLSQLLLDAGHEFCALFTDLANPISNSIYQKIGYRPICDFDEYRFS